MCTIPPAPALPLPTPESLSLPNLPKCGQSSLVIEPDVCQWAVTHPELREACAKQKICLQTPPFQFKYKYFESMIQVGPTCGMVALSMVVNGEVTADEILNISKFEGYSCNGEMFSCKNLATLAGKVLSLAEIENIKCTLKKGGLTTLETVEKLLNGAVLLVAYDADFNHSPALKNGHTAHWALVCGVIVIEDPQTTSDPNNIYVLCKHGKSKYLSAWKLDDLEKSNKNLWEFSPKKGTDGLIYILPEGGIGGENGLRDQFLMFEGFTNN